MTGEEYKVIRRRLGLTQEALADKLGLQREAISRRENRAAIDQEAELALRQVELDVNGGKPLDEI